MGLYLCVFDKCGEEICGVEVGPYEYFDAFREEVTFYDRQKKFDISMDTLLQHSDCDGAWSVNDCKKLIKELTNIKQVFMEESTHSEIVDKKHNIFKFMGVKPKNLYECFVDSDCEFLIERLVALCHVAIDENQPIIFQ